MSPKLTKIDAKFIAEALNLTERSVQRLAKREDWPFQIKSVRGGKQRVYNAEDLPEDVQSKLVLHLVKTGQLEVSEKQNVQPSTYVSTEEKIWTLADSERIWEWAKTRSEKQRQNGAHKAAFLIQVDSLLRHSPTKPSTREALRQVAESNDVAEGSLRRWWYNGSKRGCIDQFPTSDWAALLMPGYTGCTVRKEIDPRAWDWFSEYYLTRRQPTIAEAYRRTKETAQANGWGSLPSEDTFRRRIEDIPTAQRVFRREGAEAMARIFPPQRRDKHIFDAGEAVNGDGLKFDKLWISFPDGEILNTVTGWFWQDIRTNKFLAYRLAKTENTDMFRLATYDLTGICSPKFAWIDNTRVAANKAMTGQANGRHRFKNRDDDPLGLLYQVGIEPRFTNPDKVYGNPGAKPVERAFGIGGIHSKVATHPLFLDRGFSKKTAIPFEEFSRVVADEVARFNAQENRRTAMCHGVLSFNQAFEASFSQAEVRKIPDSQRTLLLLMPEVVTANKRSGEVQLKAGSGPWGAHRYWHESMVNVMGEKVVVYYDPADLTKDVSIYRLNGSFLTIAHNRSDVAVNDTQTAREFNKEKARFVKANRKSDKAKSRMDELARYYPAPEDAHEPEPGIIALDFTKKRHVEDGIVKERKVVGGYDEGGLQPDEQFMLKEMLNWPRKTDDD